MLGAGTPKKPYQAMIDNKLDLQQSSNKKFKSKLHLKNMNLQESSQSTSRMGEKAKQAYNNNAVFERNQDKMIQAQFSSNSNSDFDQYRDSSFNSIEKNDPNKKQIFNSDLPSLLDLNVEKVAIPADDFTNLKHFRSDKASTKRHQRLVKKHIIALKNEKKKAKKAMELVQDLKKELHL